MRGIYHHQTRTGHRLTLSTDNYQGEESDIVVVSLTRGNARGQIGFMSAPERLNVLITRARNCLIMIGNMNTFMRSHKGKDLWTRYFELLKDRNHLYDGLPVKCHRHPSRTALLKEPLDFDKHCPDGGCSEPWYASEHWTIILKIADIFRSGVVLKCGQHVCRLKCHRVSDHSQTECMEAMDKTCDRHHQTKTTCSKKNDQCIKCTREYQELERRAKRDLKLEQQRLVNQARYTQELQDIQDEIDQERRRIKYLREEEDQKEKIAKQRQELENLKDTAMRMRQIDAERQKTSEQRDLAEIARGTKENQSPAVSENSRLPPSKAGEEWQYMKDIESARNKALDELMGMIGLEEVKETFLEIKTTVDTKLRQRVSLGSQRFSCRLLGNPGTGQSKHFLRCCGIVSCLIQHAIIRQNHGSSFVRQILDIHCYNSWLEV